MSNPALFLAYRAPVTYNLQVAKEVLKHIYVAERLQVPSVAEFKSAYSLFAQRATNPAYLRGLFSSGEWATVGIYGLEAYGIYKACELCLYACQKANISFDRLARLLAGGRWSAITSSRRPFLYLP